MSLRTRRVEPGQREEHIALECDTVVPREDQRRGARCQRFGLERVWAEEWCRRQLGPAAPHLPIAQQVDHMVARIALVTRELQHTIDSQRVSVFTDTTL
ncbi:MAG: hypothetical protein QM736_11010 [Vicinamibacterales bacterium]